MNNTDLKTAMSGRKTMPCTRVRYGGPEIPDKKQIISLS